MRVSDQIDSLFELHCLVDWVLVSIPGFAREVFPLPLLMCGFRRPEVAEDQMPVRKLVGKNGGLPEVGC